MTNEDGKIVVHEIWEAKASVPCTQPQTDDVNTEANTMSTLMQTASEFLCDFTVMMSGLRRKSAANDAAGLLSRCSAGAALFHVLPGCGDGNRRRFLSAGDIDAIRSCEPHT